MRLLSNQHVPVGGFVVLTLACLTAAGCHREAGKVGAAVQARSPKTIEARERRDDEETLKGILRYVRDQSPEARKLHQERVRIAARLPEERRKARAAGILVDATEFAARRVPKAENAAPIYKEFNRLLQSRPLPAGIEEIASRVGPMSRVSPEETERVFKALAERDDLRSLLQRLAKRPRCYFEHDWSNATKADYPELAWMRRWARLIRVDAARIAIQGDPREAVRLLEAGARIIEHATAQPTLLSLLVGVAVSAILMNGLEVVLQLRGDDPSLCGVVAGVVSGWKVPQDLARTLRDDAAAQRTSWETLGRADIAAVVPSASAAAPHLTRPQIERLRVMADATQAVMLSRLHRLVQASRLDYPERLHRLSSFLKPGDLRNDPLEYAPALADDMAFGAARAMAQRLANREVLRLGAQVLSRKELLSDPMAAQRLVAQTLDPLTGGPLNYRTRGRGFVIYSSKGLDGTFDGEPRADLKRSEVVMFMYPPEPWPE